MTVYKTTQTPLPSGSKFVKWSGRTYAVQNWQHRENNHDAVIVRPLNESQSAHYRDGKKKGSTDTSLYFHIFPEPKKGPSIPAPAALPASKQTVKVELGMLYKDQLIKLIEKQARTKISSLTKLDREDLESLLVAMLVPR